MTVEEKNQALFFFTRFGAFDDDRFSRVLAFFSNCDFTVLPLLPRTRHAHGARFEPAEEPRLLFSRLYRRTRL